MNVLPCAVKDGQAIFAGQTVQTDNAGAYRGGGKGLELGIRPEFVTFGEGGIPVNIVKVLDAGRYRIVETVAAGGTVKLLVPEAGAIPAGAAHLRFDGAHARIYENGWLVT